MYLKGERRYMGMKKLNYIGFKFSDFFTDLIRENGVTQSDISKVTGITQTTLSRYANNVGIPTKKSMRQILEVVVKELPFEDRKALIDEKMAIYESIKQSYLKSR